MLVHLATELHRHAAGLQVRQLQWLMQQSGAQVASINRTALRPLPTLPAQTHREPRLVLRTQCLPVGAQHLANLSKADVGVVSCTRAAGTKNSVVPAGAAPI